jgi:hypothetical protein
MVFEQMVLSYAMVERRALPHTPRRTYQLIFVITHERRPPTQDHEGDDAKAPHVACLHG